MKHEILPSNLIDTEKTRPIGLPTFLGEVESVRQHEIERETERRKQVLIRMQDKDMSN